MRRPRRARLARPELDRITFKGGYDTETRPWRADPGTLRDTQNYEIGVNNQGYQDIQGYESFSGQPAPSDGQYAILDVTITGSFSVGDIITQLVSGATAVVILVVTSGTPDELIITKITGTFDATNDLQVSGVTEGTAASVARIGAANTPKLNGQYLNLAADEYRADIAAVSGSGDVLGVYMLDDIWYAFRNNVAVSQALLYKESSTGWVNVPLGRELSFTSGGTYVVAEGDIITGAISGATATVTRVLLESGSTQAGDAVGRFIFASQTGTFQAENLDVGANLDVATIAVDGSAITLLPGGRFEMIRENFTGFANNLRIYGCDGVNRGFEFDGSVFAPISTGMVIDAPGHITEHKKHLFFAFAGSAQHSAPGRPYIFSPIFGAAELATGDVITGFMSEPGSEGSATLGIYNRNTSYVLYGTSVLDWNLVKYRTELGAYAHTIQQFGQTMYLDDRGVTTFRTVLAYGNFQQATVSRAIQTYINAQKTFAKASCIARDKNQYRLFFSDGRALYITTEDTKIAGLMPIIFTDPVTAIASLEKNDGEEMIVFGSSNGKVYHLDRGTSFDGAFIEAFIKLHYSFAGAIEWKKKYLNVTLEVQGTGYAELNITSELGYTIADVPQPSSQTQDLNLSDTRWDTGITWDQFVWDGISLTPTRLKLSGSAENISLAIQKNSDYFQPINITGAMIRFTFRRQLR